MSTRPWRPQVFQRQLSKEGLQQVVNSGGAAEGEGGLSAAAMSTDELRDLFQLRTATMSDTFDSMCAGDSSDVHVDDLPEGPLPQEAICKEQACCLASLNLNIVGPIGVRHNLYERVQGRHSIARWSELFLVLQLAPSCVCDEGSSARLEVHRIRGDAVMCS